jgi:hypothetical protein
MQRTTAVLCKRGLDLDSSAATPSQLYFGSGLFLIDLTLILSKYFSKVFPLGRLFSKSTPLLKQTFTGHAKLAFKFK